MSAQMLGSLDFFKLDMPELTDVNDNHNVKSIAILFTMLVILQ